MATASLLLSICVFVLCLFACRVSADGLFTTDQYWSPYVDVYNCDEHVYICGGRPRCDEPTPVLEPKSCWWIWQVTSLDNRTLYSDDSVPNRMFWNNDFGHIGHHNGSHDCVPSRCDDDSIMVALNPFFNSLPNPRDNDDEDYKVWVLPSNSFNWDDKDDPSKCWGFDHPDCKTYTFKRDCKNETTAPPPTTHHATPTPTPTHHATPTPTPTHHTEKPTTAPPTQKPTTGTQPTQKPTTGTQPTQKPTTGTQPTQKPTTGTQPTQKPTTGTQPTQKPTTGTGVAPPVPPSGSGTGNASSSTGGVTSGSGSGSSGSGNSTSTSGSGNSTSTSGNSTSTGNHTSTGNGNSTSGGWKPSSSGPSGSSSSGKTSGPSPASPGSKNAGPTSGSNSKKNNNHAGLIAGLVVGLVALAAIAGGVGYFLWRRHKKNQQGAGARGNDDDA